MDRFESILASFTDAVIIVDENMMIEWVNPAVEQLFGKSRNITEGKLISDLFPIDSDIYNEINHSISSGVSLTDHDLLLTLDQGRTASVALTVQPAGESGRAETIILLRDMTGFTALQRTIRLQDRLKELSLLAAGLAHEIKNPLTGIKGAAQLLHTDAGDDKMKSYTSLIVKESDRIDRLVTGFIKLNDPMEEFARTSVNIYPILDKVITLLEPLISERLIAIEKDYDPSLPPIMGNSDRLSQIFLNLVKNGIEACDNRGAVTLRTRFAWGGAPVSAGKLGHGKYALVEIIDDGHGLDDDAKRDLFTPFHSKKSGGSGLGLAVTLHLVQKHEGMLEIENRNDSQGVIASVYLPYPGP